MPSTYRRPGVYLQESLLLNPSDVAGTTTVAAFIGLALKGPVNVPVLIESWSDYATIYGGFDPIPPPVPAADPLNLTGTVFPLPADVPNNLAALKAHATKGDGDITTPEFTAGAHIILKDASKAHYTPLGATGVWSVGPMPGTVPLEPSALSYLPFAVYSFFQNGGRFAWIVRAAELETGVASTIGVMDAGAVGPPVIAARQSFKLTALSPGKWGDNIGYRLLVNSSEPRVFSLEILQKSGATDWETMERFQNLSVRGTIAGSRRVDSALNDSLGGSRYVKVTNLDLNVEFPLEKDDDPVALAGGGDPGWPDIDDLSGAPSFLGGVEGPLMVNVCSYLNNESFRDRPGELDDDDDSVLVGTTFSPTIFPDREDVMVINDYSRAKDYSASVNYASQIRQDLSVDATSYTAAYGPWILVPHPTQVGAVIPIPPGGAIMGVVARIDATVGYHRAPAGVIATLSNAVGVQAKFTDTELGDLNHSDINIIRPVVGAGICVMGARTRKSYGPDHYISARRTLISLKESLRRSTQYAVFENNDERLWSSLRITADNILRPLWERGGLRGSSPNQAYYIRCDSSLNTINVIASGEVRMEIGVALEYPAEFVIIKITQITSTQFTNEVQAIS